MIQPALGAVAVTPSDSTDLTSYNGVGLYVGVAGNISVSINGQTVLFKGATAGSIIPIRVQKVMSTSTTATDIVLLCG